MRYWREDLSGQDFRAPAGSYYFGECKLDSTRFADVSRMTFYACTGSPDFSECPDLSLAYMRQNRFLSVLIAADVGISQHDIMGSIIRTVAQSRPGMKTDMEETADRIQSDYTRSWPDFYTWMVERYGVQKTRHLVAAMFTDHNTAWERFKEVDIGR